MSCWGSRVKIKVVIYAVELISVTGHVTRDP